jgi:hypothetical protein
MIRFITAEARNRRESVFDFMKGIAMSRYDLGINCGWQRR